MLSVASVCSCSRSENYHHENAAHRDRLAGSGDRPRLVAVAGTARFAAARRCARHARRIDRGAGGRGGATCPRHPTHPHFETKPERCSQRHGGTGRWPVGAGDPPTALRAPGRHPLVREISLPKLGGKLPPRTARLAVPPGFDCIDSDASWRQKRMADSLYGPATFPSVTSGRGSWERLPQPDMKNRCHLPTPRSRGRLKPWPENISLFLKDRPRSQRIHCVTLGMVSAARLRCGNGNPPGRARKISSRTRRRLVSEENHLRQNPPIGSGNRQRGESLGWK